MEVEKKTLRVNIYGTEYPIRGAADVEYTQKVANFIDSKMRQIDQRVSAKSPLKVAILASLNIADELFRERLEKEELIEKYESKIKNLVERLEESLQTKQIQ